jgi:hypothetical protein
MEVFDEIASLARHSSSGGHARLRLSPSRTQDTAVSHCVPLAGRQDRQA